MALFGDGIISYVENPKCSNNKKLLELINSVNLQETKSTYRTLLHFFSLITNYQTEKWGKYSIYNFIQKKKIPRNKFNQGGERPVL